MKAATLNELKSELKTRTPKTLLEFCIRIAKFKKDNKELLTYLLYEAEDENSFIKNIKEEIDELFADINKSNIYYIKKSLRKILRTINKYIRYSGRKQTEAELLIYYCGKIKSSGVSIKSSAALSNLYQRQIQRIRKAISTLHEDLQYDYGNELKLLIHEG
jgi:hypothetical protein